MKIKFMKKHPFAIGIFILECFCIHIIFILSLFDKKYIISCICLLIVVFMYLVCFISDIYGIRISKKYIILRDGNCRKKYLLADIKNIEVTFTKKNKHYKVDMKLNFNTSYKKKRFMWDEINIPRCGFVKTKINDKNLQEYINVFNRLNIFYVYPVKEK